MDGGGRAASGITVEEVHAQGCGRQTAPGAAVESNAGSSCRDDPAVIEKMLTHLNKKTASAKPAPWHESRAPPQTVLFDGA
jgi:hypothetical protein